MTEQRQAGLLLTAQESGVLRIGTPEDRRILQHAIYLLQEVLDLNLGYCYRWYFRGPYCSDVLQDARSILSKDQPVNAAQYQLTVDARTRICYFKERILGARPENMPAVTWLELLASLHYIARHDPYVTPSDAEQAFRRLQELKPNFGVCNQAVFPLAWETLMHAEVFARQAFERAAS